MVLTITVVSDPESHQIVVCDPVRPSRFGKTARLVSLLPREIHVGATSGSEHAHVCVCVHECECMYTQTHTLTHTHTL